MWNSTMTTEDHQKNWNTQLHNMISHGAINHPTIRHFTAPPTGM
jgi:hypothetical protein